MFVKPMAAVGMALLMGTGPAATQQLATRHLPPRVATAAADLNLLDLNTATRDQLTRFKGIGLMYADKILRGRPYHAPSELVSRRIMPLSLWLHIRHRLVATPTPAPETPPWVEPDLGRLDVNHASSDELRRFKGIGQMWADKIIRGRPYKAAIELVGRRIMPLSAYERIQGGIFAKPD